MGIDRDVAEFLLHAHSMDVSFKSTLMIGRQTLYASRGELSHVLNGHNRPVTAEARLKFQGSTSSYAEEFLSCLGAQKIDSMDFSEFEGATITHDLNRPIPDHLNQKFDVVFDGGSLEHVFDVRTGFRNIMSMVRVGGHFLGVSPANSFMGHGFYQFSPEFFFEVFSEQNGFRVRQVILCEYGKKRWYEVTAPREVRSRVLLGKSVKVYAMIIAQRIADVPVFAVTPQQSDYAAAWAGDGVPAPSKMARKSRDMGISSRFTEAIKYFWCRGIGRTYFEPSYYKRIR
jgi:SAM-dependent methyltransferase